MNDPGALPETWNDISEAYEAYVAPFLTKFARSAVHELKTRAWEHARALDVACGPGTASVLLAEAFEQVTALDFSAEMLGRCRARVQALPVNVVEGDGQALPMQDDTFDAAISMFGLIFFPKRHLGLTELRRVVREGAPALVGCWTTPDKSDLIQALAGSIAPDFPELLEQDPGPPGMDDPDRILAEFNAAGFSDPEIVTVSHTMDGPTAEEMWEAFEISFFPVKLMRQRLGNKWERARPSMLERFRGIAGPGPCAIESTAYLAVATA